MALALLTEAFIVNAPSVWYSLSHNCQSAEYFGSFIRVNKLNCLIVSTEKMTSCVASHCLACLAMLVTVTQSLTLNKID